MSLKIISHRGNVEGSDRVENTWAAISNALSLGFDIEIDVWLVDGKFRLGHDEPGDEVDGEWLKDGRLWCHAKNMEALVEMLKCGIHCFWHEEDRCTLTSRGLIWCYPGVWVADGITVAKGTPADEGWGGAAGVCTDHPLSWRRWHLERVENIESNLRVDIGA